MRRDGVAAAERRARTFRSVPSAFEPVTMSCATGKGSPPTAREDAERLRAVAAELGARELAFGRTRAPFFRADGWRRLGYATAAQYARERLGMSLSSLKAKRHLARRLAKLPALARAFEGAELGYEATRLVANVATPETAKEWTDRARGRGLVFLREEIAAAELLTRWNDAGAPLPPSDEAIEQVATPEREILKGSSVTDAAARAGLAAGQNGAPHGNVTLRLHLPATIASDYRRLEAIYLRRRRL